MPARGYCTSGSAACISRLLSFSSSPPPCMQLRCVLAFACYRNENNKLYLTYGLMNARALKTLRSGALMKIELGSPYIEDLGDCTIGCGTASVPSGQDHEYNLRNRWGIISQTRTLAVGAHSCGKRCCASSKACNMAAQTAIVHLSGLHTSQCIVTFRGRASPRLHTI